MDPAALQALFLEETPLQTFERIWRFVEEINADTPEAVAERNDICAHLFNQMDLLIPKVVPTTFRGVPYFIYSYVKIHNRFLSIHYATEDYGIAFKIVRDVFSEKLVVYEDKGGPQNGPVFFWVPSPDQSDIEIFNHIEKFFF